MEIVKTIFDYSKTPFEKEIAKYLATRLDSVICSEKITNKDFMIKNLEPLNDFVIYTNSVCASNLKRV